MLSVSNLKCEYQVNPLGIDILRPRMSWTLMSEARGVVQTAYRIQVSREESFNSIAWDTGKVEAAQSLHLEYAGALLQSRTRYWYRVMAWDNQDHVSEWSGPAFWEMGLLKSEEWIAEWIAADRGCARTEIDPMLRTTFQVKGNVKSARIYVSSLGLYQLQLNGARVGDWLLTPGWTCYEKRIQYQTYDVTAGLQQGENALGAMLGAGWYKGDITFGEPKDTSAKRTALISQLHITYEDGREQVIVSDESWKSTDSPILMSEIYHGETYDARLEKMGWDAPGYRDEDWQGVVRQEYPRNVLVAQENVPVRVVEQIKPINLFKTPEGDTVLDMGQNMVGWIRFTARGNAGSRIVLQHAEVLDKDGNFYTANLRRAKQQVEYILKGGGEEIFEPHFTFQGFRYVRLAEYPGEPSLEDFTGMVFHSDMDRTGSFSCSNTLINQLQHNILWGQKGNFVDVPTDCPQRDERLGWTGDAQMFIRTACFNMNVAPFFTKWLRDVKAYQLPNGGVPFVVPNTLDENAHSSSAWGDAAVICPWTIYLCYGDKRILAEQYDSMKAWVEYIRHQGEDEYLWNTGFQFGDWLGLDAKEDSYIGATATDFIATAFYAYSTELVAKTARVIGREQEADTYDSLYQNILKAFRQEFITPSGRLSVPTQTAHVLALMFDLVEEKDRKRTAGTLVKYLEENKFHLTTGFVGTPYLCHVLSDNGYTDVAFKLLLQTDYPSWLYQVTKGATTIWEHWDGIKVDGSFWSADMNSFNHYAYGSIGDWLYRKVAGIDTDEQGPGYRHIQIKPQPGGEFTDVSAQLLTGYGPVKSGWHMDKNAMTVEVQIPHNTSAEVVLPKARLDGLLEGEKPIGDVDGIVSYEEIPEGVKLNMGSGTYRFAYGI